MPHFGLMDESSMSPSDAELLRTRLHIRAARRRIREGKSSTGLATLFDALLSALRWYALSGHAGPPGLNPDDERSVYDALVLSGRLDGRLDFDSFNRMAEAAVNKKPRDYGITEILREFESVMVELGVMPFDEEALPPEKPGAP